MCGGKGTRLESPHEKPLHPIDGVPMVERVLEALEESRVGTIFAAVSPNAPETRAHLQDLERRERAGNDARLRTIETPGDGYVADLTAILERDAISTPVLTVAADLPLLEGSVVDRVLERHAAGARERSLTVCVPVALEERLGIEVDTRLESADHLAPTGLNVVGDAADSETVVSYDPRLAVNVNRIEDARLAAKHL